PVFQQINFKRHGNAAFPNVRIFRTDRRISYDEGKTHTCLPFTLTNPNDVVKFASFIENNKKAYQCSYKVNYKGETRVFDSGTLLSKGDEPLTIDVSYTGVLLASVQAGDIDFHEVAHVLDTVN